ncbi:non-ribosomal peptide synthetase, partial [Photorhabdus bodei]
PIVLSVEDFGDALGLTAQVVQPFESARLCDYMQQALESLAEALEHTPDRPVRALEILPEAERTLLLTTWNATETTYPDSLCIHQLFEQQVEKTPDATALIYEEQTLSYAELNARANRLAHQLIMLGVEPDQQVAICVTRSPAMVIGLLAVLKAGGAYVPLDPTYPGERLAYMLKDTAPSIVLADVTGQTTLGEKALAKLVVLDPNILPDQPDTNPLMTTLMPHHLAYVIYTSGSTGTPKGVMLEHRGVCNYLLWARRDYLAERQFDSIVSSPLAFDATVTSLYLPLLCGGKIHLLCDGQELIELLPLLLSMESGILVKITPGHLLAIGQELKTVGRKCPAHCFVVGGEALPSSIVTLWQTLSPGSRIINEYGPTETVVGCAVFDTNCPSCFVDSVPIGRPISNTQIYILDPHGEPVPMGVVGELYIGGVAVARGYLNRPELTAERFLPDLFSDRPDARMYRTGDLARYLSDGNLVFVGRNDHQIKIRGFRIELGEIEARLTQHPEVCEARVLVQAEGPNKRLVAYMVAPENDGLVNRLREHLSNLLPDYMMPAAFVRLDAFPLTLNGKLDRRALPAPEADAFARQVYEAPQGEVEVILAAIWCDLLGIEQISRYDNFFVLGGNSLLAVRMVERLRNRGLTLAVRDLFQSPVLAKLAKVIVQYRVLETPANAIMSATTTITPEMLPLIDLTQSEIDLIIRKVPGGIANIQDIYALSPLQDGILFHHLLANEGDPYLSVGQMAFTDRGLLDRYLAAVQWVVNRHDILRTAFIWQGLSVPCQVVWRQAPLSVTELTLDPADGKISDQLIQRFDPRQYRLDLSQAPLLCFVVTQEEDGSWRVLELLHHLIGDHTTLEVMQSEVQAYFAGRRDSLPAPVPFRNLVAQARLGISQAEHARFFTDMLTGVEEPTLPFGVTEVHHDGSQVIEFHQILTAELNDRLRAQAKCLGVSLATLCHVAWGQVLARTSGQQKVVFGTV